METRYRQRFFNPNLVLIGLLVLVSMLVIIRIIVSPSGGLSPDSLHYLESAQYLSQGQGYLTTFGEHRAYNVTWPIGYSLGIAVLHSLTGLSVFWSSKLLNWLVWLGCFAVSWRVFRSRAWFVVLPLCTGSAVKLLSYSWSECLFLGLLLLYCWQLSQFGASVRPRYWLALGSLVVALFLVRYVGGFALIPLGVWSLFALKQRQWATLLSLLITSSISLACMLAYVVYNEAQTGYWFGERSLTPLAPNDYAAKLCLGLFNEILVVKDWNGHLNDWLCGMGIVLQIWVWWRCRTVLSVIPNQKVFPRLAQIMLGVAGSYLSLLLIPSLTPYMDFNYRFFAPATLLVQISIQLWLAVSLDETAFSRLKIPLSLLYLSSLVEAGISGNVSWLESLRLFQEKIF